MEGFLRVLYLVNLVKLIISEIIYQKYQLRIYITFSKINDEKIKANFIKHPKSIQMMSLKEDVQI